MRPASVHQSARVPALQFSRVHAYPAVLDTVVQHQYRGGHEWVGAAEPPPDHERRLRTAATAAPPTTAGHAGSDGAVWIWDAGDGTAEWDAWWIQVRGPVREVRTGACVFRPCRALMFSRRPFVRVVICPRGVSYGIHRALRSSPVFLP